MMPSVVVADDSSRVRDLLVDFLEDEGFEVLGVASDGGEAVEAACTLHPDLLLMDARMPGVSGLDALPRVLAECRGTRVVLFTGHDDPWLQKEAMAAGAAAVLTKGEDLEALVARLRQL